MTRYYKLVGGGQNTFILPLTNVVPEVGMLAYFNDCLHQEVTPICQPVAYLGSCKGGGQRGGQEGGRRGREQT